MKRLAAGAAALALAGVGSIGLAGPLGAQAQTDVDWDLRELDWDDVRVDVVELDGSLSPETAGPGDEVTVTSECNLALLSDPAHDHEVRWALVEAGTFPGWDELPETGQLTFPAIDQGTVDVPGEDEDYIWTATFEAPAEAGSYEFVAVCVPIDLAGYPHCDVGLYGPTDLTLEVEEQPEEPEEPEEEPEEPEEAPPAAPVTGQPDFTG